MSGICKVNVALRGGIRVTESTPIWEIAELWSQTLKLMKLRKISQVSGFLMRALASRHMNVFGLHDLLLSLLGKSPPRAPLVSSW